MEETKSNACECGSDECPECGSHDLLDGCAEELMTALVAKDKKGILEAVRAIHLSSMEK
jgi:hypothetical protein